jgi:hypothetical protein
MKWTIRSLLACVAGSLVGVSPAAAEEKPPKEPLAKAEVFRAFRRSLEPSGKVLIEAKMQPESHKQAEGLLTGVHSSLRSLEAASEGQEVPKPYLVSLTRDAWMLEKGLTLIRKKDEEREQGLAFLKAVSADLAAKKASIDPAGALRLVNVEVETKDVAGTSEGNCEVYYVLQGLAPYPDAYSRYPKLSTPTNDDVTPGEYFFWTVKGDKKGKLTPVTVRDTGTGKRSVDIPVP